MNKKQIFVFLTVLVGGALFLVQRVSNPTRSIESMSLKEIQREATLNVAPDEIADEPDIVVMPFLRGGEIVGFRVVALREGSRYDKLGLRRDDLIVAVEGGRVDSGPEARRQVEDILTSSRSPSTLEVLRDSSSLRLPAP